MIANIQSQYLRYRFPLFTYTSFCCKWICFFFYNKRDDFDFGIVNFPFLDGDVHRRASYGDLVFLGGSGVRLYDGIDLKLSILVGWVRSFLSVAWPTGDQLVFFFCFGVSKLFGPQGSTS